MVVNNATFGELVSEARGDRTQDRIASLGGPPRQRLSQIEFGDPVELTSTVLSQLDTAFNWGTRTSELLLTPVHRPRNLDTMIAALDQTPTLGVDEGGDAVAMPRLLAVDHLMSMLPLITRWPGPVLIDIGAGTEKGRAAQLLEWLIASGDINTSRLRRTGLDGPHDAAAIAVDPFNDVRSTNSAAGLLSRIESFGGNGRERTPGEYRDMAPTVLFIASQTKQQDGLTVLSRLNAKTIIDGFDGNLKAEWAQFFKTTGLSSRLENIDQGVLQMLSPLLTLKDFHSELVIADDNLSVQARGDVTVVRPTDLAGTVLFYDAVTCPFLPVLVDHAYTGTAMAPLVFTNSIGNWRAESTAAAIPNSHLVIQVGDNWIDERSEAATTPNVVRLIDRRAGSAILIPDQQDRTTGAKSQRIWFSTRGKTESDRHLPAAASTSTAAVEFFRWRRADFGVFDKAELNRREGDGNLTIVLTDEHAARLVLNSVPHAHDADQAATILTEAGFDLGTHDITRVFRHSTLTVSRPVKPPVLRLGTAPSGDAATIDLQHGHAAIAGDDETIVWVLPQALRNRRQALPITDLAILGATTRAVRPWADVAGERALGFLGPGIGARDAAAVARWLTTELNNEMKRRIKVLNHAHGVTAEQYRAVGGDMPPLLVIIDGLDGHDEHWLSATQLHLAAQGAGHLNIRFLLSGTNPVPLMTLLETPIARPPWDTSDAEDNPVPRFMSKVAFPGAESEVAQQLIGLPAGQNTTPDGYLWTLGCGEPETFRIDQEANDIA